MKIIKTKFLTVSRVVGSVKIEFLVVIRVVEFQNQFFAQ